jgi:hypothetical protein
MPDLPRTDYETQRAIAAILEGETLARPDDVLRAQMAEKIAAKDWPAVADLALQLADQAR